MRVFRVLTMAAALASASSPAQSVDACAQAARCERFDGSGREAGGRDTTFASIMASWQW